MDSVSEEGSTAPALRSLQESRKRKYDPNNWDRIRRKKARNSRDAKPGFVLNCSHRHKETPQCAAAKLTEEDAIAFVNLIHTKEDAAGQNAVIMKFITPYSPERSRKRKEATNRKPRLNAQYYVRKTTGEIVVVPCHDPQVTHDCVYYCCVGRKRLNSVVKHQYETGEDRPERRGGNRAATHYVEIRESIKTHIRSFKVVESHYGRKKSRRQYLSCELNILRMYKMWVAERQEKNLPVCKRTLYYSVFYGCFNLAFGNPRADACGICKELTYKSLHAPTNEDRESAKLEQRLHKLRAKKFFMMVREEQKRKDTLVLSFDLQQTMPLPRTNVGQAFYCRQMWLYNFGIVVSGRHNMKNKCYVYTWDESQSGRGSNEICSALLDFLHGIKKKIEERKYRRLALFSDSCAGQNKNATMLAALLLYAQTMPFREIKYIFPIRGHSYMAPDRLFGRIEKDVRRKEEIATPLGYHEIFHRHAHVRINQKDFQMHDYKSLADSLLDKTRTNRLEMRQTRVWEFKRNSQTVGVSKVYSTPTEKKTVLKPSVTSSFRGRKPKLLPPTNHISCLKAADIEKLLPFVTLAKEEREYYNKILNVKTKKKNSRTDDVVEHPEFTKKNKK